MDSQVSHTAQQLVPQTGEQAYALIAATYGVPLKAETFVRVLVDGRGYADDGACRLMEWILDWYRPSSDGTPRCRGRLSLPSAWLADEWNVPQKRLESWRRCVTQAGLATFHSARHECWVEVHWAAVAEAAKAVSERKSRPPQNGESRFRPPQNGESKILDPPKTGSLKRLDPPKTGTKPPLPSSLRSSSLSEEEEEGVENSIPREVCDTLSEAVERCLEHGRQRGRACSGRWAADAHAAFAEAVGAGRDPEALEDAWRDYVTRRGSSATDLGHWIRGLGLDGRPRDEGEDAMPVCYTRAEAARRRATEVARVAAGGVPTPRLTHTAEGWAVSAEGVPAQLFDAVPPDATRAEAEAAWPAWWHAQRGGA